MAAFSLEDFVTTQTITNAHLTAFASSHVNLPSDLAKKYRGQANRIREQLEGYIKDHPDYSLVKMLHSGSLAKGTALRDMNDIDTAIYVKLTAVDGSDKSGLIAWLHDRLKEVYPNFDADQLVPHDHCVTIIFKTPGYKKVDVVPVLYEGEPDNRGYLIRKTGEPILTSISLHIDFVRTRKNVQPVHYAQFVRLVKWWIALKKKEYTARGGHFRFKSLMAELICARLADNGLDTSDYISALQAFFSYIATTGLQEPIYFTDYYAATDVDLSGTDLIKIYDPVNPNNNIASTYTEGQRQQIVTEATAALEAIALAKYCPTKGEAVQSWKTVLGTSFVGQL
jgi:Second Messenger Oligonucleotide or Dinucleotide Synthetase domain